MKKDNIVLVMPRTGPVLLTPPFGLLSLAARLLEKGFTVDLIDCRLTDFHTSLTRILKNRNTILVGITSMTGPQIAHGLKISQFVKKSYDVPVVWGGIHPSFLPEQTVKNGYIDYVVAGFGENSLPALASALRNKENPLSINGLFFKRGEKIIRTPDRDPREIKEFPTYAWNLVDPGSYILRGMVTKRTLSLFSSRGCPHRCTFCYGPAFHRRRWIAQPAEELLSEVDMLRARTDFDGVYFHDDNFAVDRKRVKEIALGLKERGIKFRFALRADYITEDIISFLKEHNCTGVDWGADSGSERILRKYLKDTTVEDTMNGVRILAKYEMSGQVGVMIGHPEENMEDIYKSLDLMDRIKEINPRLKVGDAKIATPYPSSRFYRDALSHGFVPPATLEEWSKFYWNNAKMPWVKNRKELEVISFTSLVVFMHWRLMKNNPVYNSLLELLHRMEKIRWKKRFWKFAWEIRLIKRYMDLNTFLLRKELHPRIINSKRKLKMMEMSRAESVLPAD